MSLNFLTLDINAYSHLLHLNREKLLKCVLKANLYVVCNVKCLGWTSDSCVARSGRRGNMQLVNSNMIKVKRNSPYSHL